MEKNHKNEEDDHETEKNVCTSPFFKPLIKHFLLNTEGRNYTYHERKNLANFSQTFFANADSLTVKNGKNIPDSNLLSNSVP